MKFEGSKFGIQVLKKLRAPLRDFSIYVQIRIWCSGMWSYNSFLGERLSIICSKFFL